MLTGYVLANLVPLYQSKVRMIDEGLDGSGMGV